MGVLLIPLCAAMGEFTQKSLKAQKYFEHESHESLMVHGSWSTDGSRLRVHDYDARGKVAFDVRCKREDVRWIKKHDG